jgi:murein DD-endopeptidase MepM/ murein hydrolase activator NlpD
MKNYLLTFTCIFCLSALASIAYVLLSHTNSVPTVPQSYSTNINLPTEKNSSTPINDFTQPEIETVEPEIIKKPLAFSMPIDSNEIGMKFSNGQLIYSKTLSEWIMHNGIDIIAKQGTPVLASESGKITEISSNIHEGIKITIEHKDGYKSVYSNLSTTKMVSEGQTVEKGQAISGVGKTATFEYEEKDHLHFEVYKDNKAVNPLSLISG